MRSSEEIGTNYADKINYHRRLISGSGRFVRSRYHAGNYILFCSRVFASGSFVPRSFHVRRSIKLDKKTRCSRLLGSIPRTHILRVIRAIFFIFLLFFCFFFFFRYDAKLTLQSYSHFTKERSKIPTQRTTSIATRSIHEWRIDR